MKYIDYIIHKLLNFYKKQSSIKEYKLSLV